MLQLFVFLFAPLSHHLKESDFTNNYRLENGLKLWQAMWEFRHPDAPCFTMLVKPKPIPFGGQFFRRNQHGDVFMGRKCKVNTIYNIEWYIDGCMCGG